MCNVVQHNVTCHLLRSTTIRVSENWPTVKRTFASAFANMLQEGGCNNFPAKINQAFGNDLEDMKFACGGYYNGLWSGPGNTPVKPLSLICPVACGCKSGDYGCPTTCPVGVRL